MPRPRENGGELGTLEIVDTAEVIVRMRVHPVRATGRVDVRPAAGDAQGIGIDAQKFKDVAIRLLK